MPHKILLVDDDAAIIAALSVHLKNKGFETVSASDAISAVIMAQRHSPDLFILDFQMPAGTGANVYDKLRALRGALNVPVIFLSGFIDNARNLVAASPFVRFLSKPADLDQLLVNVHELLKLPPPADGKKG